VEIIAEMIESAGISVAQPNQISGIEIKLIQTSASGLRLQGCQRTVAGKSARDSSHKYVESLLDGVRKALSVSLRAQAQFSVAIYYCGRSYVCPWQ
jgi:hypothetical protein